MSLRLFSPERKIKVDFIKRLVDKNQEGVTCQIIKI